MMKVVYFTAIAAFLAGPVSAQECAAIDNDLDRLACYDRESGRTAKTEITTPTEGNWSIRTDKSEFKDTTDVFLTLKSDKPLTCNRYGGQVHANLIIRCMENTTTIYVGTNCHLASGVAGYGKVEYRVDDRKAKTRNFDASTDNKALGLWNGSRAIPLIKELLNSDSLLLRYTPYSMSSETTRFTITGLDEAIKPLRKECNW